MKLKIKLIVITLSLLGAVGISAQEKPSGDNGSEKVNYNTTRSNKKAIKDKDNNDDSAEELQGIANVTWDGKEFDVQIVPPRETPKKENRNIKKSSPPPTSEAEILKFIRKIFPNGFPPEVESVLIQSLRDGRGGVTISIKTKN